jgi:acetyl esterase/lipase
MTACRSIEQFPDYTKSRTPSAGPYNFIPVENRNVQPVFHHPHTPPASQPINHVETGLPPALLIAAEEDEVVNPARNTGALTEALRNHGVPVKSYYFDHLGHAALVATLSPVLSSLVPTLDLIERFIQEHRAPESSDLSARR